MATKYGYFLEQWVMAQLKSITDTIVPGSKSGSAGNKTASDIFTKTLQIECKRRNEDGKVSNTIIKRQWWTKLTNRARMNGKIPVIITSERNKEDTMITMRLRDFVEIMSHPKDNEL